MTAGNFWIIFQALEDELEIQSVMAEALPLPRAFFTVLMRSSTKVRREPGLSPGCFGAEMGLGKPGRGGLRLVGWVGKGRKGGRSGKGGSGLRCPRGTTGMGQEMQ